MARIFGFLLLGVFVFQTLGLKQQAVQSPPPVFQQVPLRVCGCEELNRCYQDQVAKDRNLVANCRQACAEKIFLNPTLQKVSQCYDEYERTRADVESRTRQCVEEMGSRQCVSSHTHTPPQTVTINATDYLQTGAKRNHKIAYPDSINQLNSCVRTCFKNQGIIQFNPDGTLIKAPKTPKTNGNGEKTQNKNGKEYSLCATQLNCQLAPLDKKLDKHAKQLCKFQPVPQGDHDSKLCGCLETALGQNLHCAEQFSPQGSCSSPTAQCSETRQTGRK